MLNIIKTFIIYGYVKFFLFSPITVNFLLAFQAKPDSRLPFLPCVFGRFNYFSTIIARFSSLLCVLINYKNTFPCIFAAISTKFCRYRALPTAKNVTYHFYTYRPHSTEVKVFISVIYGKITVFLSRSDGKKITGRNIAQ